MSRPTTLAQRIGRLMAGRAAITAAATVLVFSAVACVGVTSLLAGLVDRTLGEVVFVVGVLATPPVCLAIAIPGALLLRRAVLGPLDAALIPALGPVTGSFPARRWQGEHRGRAVKGHFFRNRLELSVDCAPVGEARFARGNPTARGVEVHLDGIVGRGPLSVHLGQAAPRALAGVITEQGQALVVRPGGLSWVERVGGNRSPEEMGAVVEALVTLAERSEDAGALSTEPPTRESPS